MKLSCLQENLIVGLSTVSHAVAAKGGLPVLANILFTTEEGRLKLTATDLEITIVTWVRVKVEEEGSLTVPAKVVTEVINSLPPGQVELSTEQQVLKISAERVNTRVNGASSDDFPSLPRVAAKVKIPIADVEALRAAISQVTFAAAKDEGRPVLTGVLLKTQGGGLVLAGVDGFRLSEKRLGEVSSADLPEVTAVIPAKALNEVARLFSKGDQQLTVEFASQENQIVFRSEDVELSSRLLEGEFPDYTKIVPPEFSTTASLETAALLEGVRLVSIFAQGGSNVVNFKLGAGTGSVQISAGTQEVGEGQTEVPAQISGLGGEIAFNARYLMECLNNLRSEKVELAMIDALKPGRFVPVPAKGETSDFYHIIMPVRVQG